LVVFQTPLIPRDYTPEFIYCSTILFANDKRFFDPTKLLPFTNLGQTQFAHYLSGLIEGDGCIVVPTTERSLKNRLNYPSVQISFDLHDFPFAMLIQKELKHGSLSRAPGKKRAEAYVLTINNYEGL